MSARPYDIVVLGASGYTGKLTAEYITKSLPTDLRWAIAGRSQSKLESVAAECKTLNVDRVQPAIEVCNLNDKDLTALAKKTVVLLNTVGPYALHGEPVYKACAHNGTHYLDVTAEFPFTADMIKKYETAAKASGSIMISQIGLESAPADLLAWSVVGMIRDRFSAPTSEVVVSVHDLNASLSGGTLATVFGILDVYSLKEILAAAEPYALSPVPGPKIRDNTSWVTKLLGIRVVPDLGVLTSSISNSCDPPIVQRSWGILNYGPNFRFGVYGKARNHLTGIAIHFGLLFVQMLLAIPLFRMIAKRFLPRPGEGPTKELGGKDRLDIRAIGTPDVQMPNPPRAFSRVTYTGSIYALTATFLAEAAMTIIHDDHKLSGGIYTPACLGEGFVNRLEPAGFKLEKRFYEN